MAYLERYPNSYPSATKIVPIMLEIIGPVSSVVDVGGGHGAWCKAFKEHGVRRVLCIDTPEIASGELLIDVDEFFPCDLSTEFPTPNRTDLAICLEVAEHLPPRTNRHLINFLTSSADIILFSASIPGQPDPSHINEHAPDYWRTIFADFDFKRWDIIRPRIIDADEISYWYRQNIFIYATSSWDRQLEKACKAFRCVPEDFELVHRKVLNVYRQPPRTIGLGALIRELPDATRRTLAARVRSVFQKG